MKKKIYNYAELKERYNELMEEKGDILSLKAVIENLKGEIESLNKLNRKLAKEKIELSYLVTELMKGRR